MEPFVLGVDLDDVVGDYVASFRRVVALELRLDLNSLGPIETWSYADSSWPIESNDHYLALHKKGVAELGLFLEMPFIENAPEVLWKLSDEGAWVRIVTHRVFSNWSHSDSVSHTVEWLDNGPPGYMLPSGKKTAIPYRDLCFVSNKPEVGAHLYIEDSPSNIKKLQDSNADVIIFERTHNKGVPGQRARSWNEVYEMVQEKMAAHERLTLLS